MKSNKAQQIQQIYALQDPRDGLIYYVGRSKNAYYRFDQHLRGYYGSRREWKWVKGLRQVGMVPTLVILEVIEDTPKIHRTAHEREQYWINEMLAAGQPLLNVYGVSRPFPPLRRPRRNPIE